ncbi:hypothetical protein E2C01_036102 [Portunus trituberculatus]|uniref:Uncharacterized protein n=1 Tax=Portunus trituberculatus TaxID=210409 RepID=A0A5B7F4V9_PORTR|nr:hypothetical protein [Portunus trituberculatus]
MSENPTIASVGLEDSQSSREPGALRNVPRDSTAASRTFRHVPLHIKVYLPPGCPASNFSEILSFVDAEETINCGNGDDVFGNDLRMTVVLVVVMVVEVMVVGHGGGGHIVPPPSLAPILLPSGHIITTSLGKSGRHLACCLSVDHRYTSTSPPFLQHEHHFCQHRYRHHPC